MRWPSKETRERVRIAKDRGWEFDGFTGKGHPRIRHASGKVLTLASTASDRRSRANFLADLKKHTPESV